MSDRYRRLVAGVSRLRRSLLPATFDLTGSYPLREHDRAKAFRLLVHAEVESFLEDRVIEVARERIREWKGSRKLSPCIVALLAFEESTRAEPTSLIAPPSQKQANHLEERITRAHTSFNYYVTKNNGVKEANTLKLLMSVGVEAHQIDVTWLTSLDSWAAERGEYAHKGQLTTLNDPKDELQSAVSILKGFRVIDIALDSC